VIGWVSGPVSTFLAGWVTGRRHNKQEKEDTAVDEEGLKKKRSDRKRAKTNLWEHIRNYGRIQETETRAGAVRNDNDNANCRNGMAPH